MQSNLTEKEYKNLIRSVKEKDNHFVQGAVRYIEEKLDIFLEKMSESDFEWELWLNLKPNQKSQTLLTCIELDLHLLNLTTKQRNEIVPDLLKIFEESLYRKFAKEWKEEEEIVVDPECQDLLDEALAKIDGVK